MAEALATLTGVITDPRKKLSTLMSYYFKSLDYNIGEGDSSQYSFTVDLTGDDPVGAMNTSVRRVLEGHFDEVSAEVTFNAENSEYTFQVNVVEGGVTYPLTETHSSVAADFNDYQDI